MESTSLVSFGERSIRLRVSAASDVGNVRVINEDSFLAATPVFLVADGMGGHAHGDRASGEVVRVFTERHADETSTSAERVLESITAANAAVRSLTEPTAIDAAVAGTTMTGVALLAGEQGGLPSWMAFNVGDSRIYGWKADRLEQITVDHSAVQELVDQGQITRAEADVHPERNVVTRAMGVDDEPDVDVWLIPAGGNQLFLLCSDGLTKELSDDRISEAVRQSARESDGIPLAEQLVAAAVSAGGNDNVTVVVVEADWITTADHTEVDAVSPMPAFLEETAPRG